MSEQASTHGLARASERIEELRSDLDLTVDSVTRLTRIGEPELALKLIDEQRSALDEIVILISEDVAAPTSWRQRARKHAAALSAAALLVLTTLGATIVMAQNDGPVVARLGAQLDRAQRIEDPAARLASIASLYERSRHVRNGDFAARLAAAAAKTRDDLQDDGETDPAIIAQADALVRDTQQRAPLPPRSSNKSPIETVQDLLKK